MLLVLLLALLIGCADEPPAGPVCGDGICNGNESWATCGDCPRCPPDCPVGYSCQYPGGCHRDVRSYTITIDKASLPAARFDGSPWDDEPGIDAAPDPRAVMRLDDDAAPALATATLPNTLEPHWATSVERGGFYMPSTVQIAVYDDDAPISELMFMCSGTLDVLPLAEFECSADGGTVHVQVGP